MPVQTSYPSEWITAFEKKQFDDLKHMVQESTESFPEWLIYLKAIRQEKDRNREEAIKSYREAETAFKRKGEIEMSLHAARNLGDLLKLDLQLSDSYEVLFNAIQVAQEFDLKKIESMLINSLIGVFWDTQDYNLSVEWLSREIKLRKELGDELRVGAAHCNLGIAYQCLKVMDAALEQFKLSLPIFEKHQHDRFIGNAAVSIGQIYLGEGKLDEAEEYLKIGGDHFRKDNHDVGIILNGLEFCKLRIAQDRVSDAHEIYYAIDFDDEKYHVNLQVLYHTIGAKLLIAEDKLEEARTVLDRELEKSIELGFLDSAVDVCELLCELAKKQGDFEGYLKHEALGKQYNEEIRGTAKQRQAAIHQKQEELNQRIQEHERDKKVLYSTLPKHVADRVIAGEKVTDDFKSASVMFLDIVDFTKLSSQTEAKNVVEMLEEIFTTIDDICEKYEVTKIKTIGDAYLAVCGVPEQIENHQEKMAKAATEILHSIKHPVRIGLHCGPLSAGVVGKERLQYDVWGDTVNVASRMESSGLENRIQVSKDFAEAIHKDELKLEERGEIDLKGKGKMKTFFINQ